MDKAPGNVSLRAKVSSALAPAKIISRFRFRASRGTLRLIRASSFACPQPWLRLRVCLPTKIPEVRSLLLQQCCQERSRFPTLPCIIVRQRGRYWMGDDWTPLRLLLRRCHRLAGLCDMCRKAALVAGAVRLTK